MLHLAIHLGRALATRPATVSLAQWLAAAAARLLTRALNMPEGVLHDTGAFVVAYVAAVEQRATLVCPRKVMREVRRKRTVTPRSHPRKETGSS